MEEVDFTLHRTIKKRIQVTSCKVQMFLFRSFDNISLQFYKFIHDGAHVIRIRRNHPHEDIHRRIRPHEDIPRRTRLENRKN